MIPLLLAAGLALGAASTPRAGETLRFAPAPDSVLVKHFDVSQDLNLDSTGMIHDGGPFQADKLVSHVTSWLTLSVEDHYLEVGEGRGTHFVRTYTDLGAGGKLKMRPEGQPEDYQADAVLVSPLRTRAIEFTWVPREDDWSRCWTHDLLDEEWLADIHGDMDMLALLPQGEVSEGDTWDLPMEAVRTLLAPGGNQKLTPRTTNVFSRTIELGVGGDYSEVLGPDLIGQASARYAGVREVDGKRLAAVELTIEGLQSIRDRTDLYRTAMPEEERRDPARLTGVLLEYHLDAKGELLWDLDEGHVHSVELSGDQGYVTTVSKDAPLPGGRITHVDAQATFSGTMSLRFIAGLPGFDADYDNGHSSKH